MVQYCDMTALKGKWHRILAASTVAGPLQNLHPGVTWAGGGRHGVENSLVGIANIVIS